MASATVFRVLAGGATAALLAGLLAAIVAGSLSGPVTDAVAAMAADPWGLATLVDVYAGLLVVAVWIWCVERRPGLRALWIPLLFVLGNVVTLVVLLLRLRRCRDLGEWLLRPLGGGDDD